MRRDLYQKDPVWASENSNNCATMKNRNVLICATFTDVVPLNTMSNLFQKRILLGVCGGIAAYKSAEIIRLLRKQGAEVQVVMTQSAKAFITPMTLQALSGHPVHEDLFDTEFEAAMGHIALARWADRVLIAPASANTLAKLASGQADCLLTTLFLAATAPKWIAPAMNQQMWHDEATQANLKTLSERSIGLIGPASGEQACGEMGLGRLSEPVDIVSALASSMESQPLSGKKVLITAGPTQEAIDPVRYLSNHSSGKMGYALAEAAKLAGAAVTLVTGPTALAVPDRVEVVQVTTAQQMHDAVMRLVPEHDIFIASAAVSDYRPTTIQAEKIKKSQAEWTLALTPNPDILKAVASLENKPLCIGFAAETESLLLHAKSKLRNKHCDMIIANDVSQSDIGFGSDDNAVTLVTENGSQPVERASKFSIAETIIDAIAATLIA